MTTNISIKTTISENLETVWSYIADFDNVPQWMPGVQGVKQIDSGELGRGSALALTNGKAIKVAKVSYWEPQKCFTLSLEKNARSTDSSYRLEYESTYTVLELNITTSVDGFRQLLSPISTYFATMDAKKRLRNIKEAIESRPEDKSN